MTVDTASMRTGHFSYSLASPATVPRSSLHSPPSKNHLALPMATITLHFGHCTCICLPCAQNRRISSHNLREFGQEGCQKEPRNEGRPMGKAAAWFQPHCGIPGKLEISLVLKSRRCSHGRTPRSENGVGITTGV